MDIALDTEVPTLNRNYSGYWPWNEDQATLPNINVNVVDKKLPLAMPALKILRSYKSNQFRTSILSPKNLYTGGFESLFEKGLQKNNTIDPTEQLRMTPLNNIYVPSANTPNPTTQIKQVQQQTVNIRHSARLRIKSEKRAKQQENTAPNKTNNADDYQFDFSEEKIYPTYFNNQINNHSPFEVAAANLNMSIHDHLTSVENTSADEDSPTSSNEIKTRTKKATRAKKVSQSTTEGNTKTKKTVGRKRKQITPSKHMADPDVIKAIKRELEPRFMDGSSSDTELPIDKRERNKASAARYRKRKKMYIQNLELEVAKLKSELSRMGHLYAMEKAKNTREIKQ